MKKLFLICLSLIFLTTPAVIRTAYARNEYMRVIDNDTAFYRSEDLSERVFYLPYTYYVKLDSVNGNVAHIECSVKGGALIIDGYAEYDKLFADDLSVENPYPDITLKTCRSAVLYSDRTLKNAVQYVFSDRELYYYGNETDDGGNNVYFVGYNGRLGYVAESDVYPFAVPNHPNPLTFIKEDEKPPEEDKPDSVGTESLRIVIIALLAASGLISLLIIVRKKDTATAVTFYDDNDYE